MLGGVAMVVGGGIMFGSGGALAVTGVGTVPGGGLAWAGAGVAAAGLTAAGLAAGRWMSETAANASARAPHPIYGGRNVRGEYNGDGQRPWVDTEKIGLDRVAERRRVEVIRDKVRATIEGLRRPGAAFDQSRYFDGLFRNADGTYTAIEIKGGTGSRSAAQASFDSTVSPERPATAILNGEKIRIVRVILETVK